MRIRQLDVLRAIAVLLVLGCHMNWNTLLCYVGGTGVDLFFCLSGFLVSGLLFRDYKATGQIHWKRFLTRRGFKIYPSYYFFLLFSAAAFQRLPRAPYSSINLWADVFFLQNYLGGSWIHLWTLGNEEQFYLLLPAGLWLLARAARMKEPGIAARRSDPFRALPWICALIMAACLALRAASLHAVPQFNHLTHMEPFHLRCDALTFGVLLSYLAEYRPAVIAAVVNYGKGRFLLTLSLLCILPAAFFVQGTPFLYIFGLTLIYLGYGGILLYCLHCWNGGGRLAGALAWIGRSSYSIYLWHLPVVYLSISLLQDRWHWGRNSVFGVYMLTSVLIGVAMARVVENPALRLRERFFPAEAARRESKASPRELVMASMA